MQELHTISAARNLWRAMNESYQKIIKAKFSPLEPFIPRGVFIGVPCHDSKYDVEFVLSLMAICGAMQEAGIDYEICNQAEGGICLARQEILYAFMTSTKDALFFIDADMVFDVDAFMSVLTCPADISLGVYTTKRLHWQKIADGIRAADNDWLAKAANFPVNMSEEMRRGQMQKIEIPDFLEIESGATGFMRIRRNVIGQIERDNPNLLYFNDLERPQYAMFNNTLSVCPDRARVKFTGEDYSFCDLARKSGFKIYADMKHEICHVGRHKFGGNFGRSILGSQPKAAIPSNPS